MNSNHKQTKNGPTRNNQDNARKLVDMAGAGVELIDRYAVGQVSIEDSQVLQAFAAALLATHLNTSSDLNTKIQGFALTVRAVYLYGRDQERSTQNGAN